MFLNSISKKIFLITFVSIYFVILFLYGYIYFSLPSNYTDYKQMKVDDALKQAQTKIQEEENSFSNKEDFETKVTTDLQALATDEQITVFISNAAGQVIWTSNQINGQNGQRGVLSPIYQTDALNNFFNYTNAINIKWANQVYTVTFATEIQEIGEVRDSLKLIIPGLIIFDFLISILIGFIFVLLLGRPIKKLNKKSKELEKFNFNNNIKIKRNDEIGELSNSLDVTSKKLDQALKELRHDVVIAREREQERRQYTSIMSHELKTPLTILRGQSECMMEGIGDYKNHDKYLAENLKIIDRMESLVQNILVSSKLDYFEDEVEKKEEPIKEIIDGLINDFELLLEQKNVKTKCVYEIEKLRVDKYTFELCLKNLIENAIKYSDENTEINIHLTAKNLKIININTKIKQNDFKNIFEPFTRIEESRNSDTGGTGIGLYIVKRTLEIHKFPYSLTKKGDKVIFLINF